MTLAEKIIALRTQHHLSQGDLAEKIGVSRQSVSKWETGASTPDLDKLILMSELFSITLDELVKGEGASIDSSNITETTANAPSSTSAPKIGIRQIFGFILFGGSILLGLLNLADTSLVIIAFCLALCAIA